MSGFYSTPAWIARRRDQLRREPWCRLCAQRGVRTKATVADHVERHGGDWRRFITGALQSLCRTCHNAVKQSYERTGALRGCDERGMPLDPNHWWRR